MLSLTPSSRQRQSSPKRLAVVVVLVRDDHPLDLVLLDHRVEVEVVERAENGSAALGRPARLEREMSRPA